MFNNYYIKKISILLLVMIAIASCKEVYNPNINSPATGYLVVDGFINSGDSPTIITLSRTTKLVDTIETLYEYGAQVNIESDNNENYPLAEQGNGKYVSGFLSLNSNEKYRLHIITSNGKEYRSDFAAVQNTPPIDSITWKVENGGVQIYTNAHDDAGLAKYFRWTYSETWEFHSPFLQTLYYATDASGLAIGISSGVADTAIYKCWKSQISRQIILGTTEKLIEDKIYLPIRYIQPQAEELSVLYYIDLKQYVLSKEAYQFYQKLKKNTEQLGSIFDAQPSELEGNIHSVNDPTEVVVGYVEVSQPQEKRLFINHDDLPIDWLPHIACQEQKLDADFSYPFYPQLIPTRVAEYMGLVIKSYYAAEPICVDCTLRGTNVRPSFWP
jgi:hypothetical protein